MSLKITFLGTAGSVPTIERSLPAIAVQREGELILFDCGEGTQRQMMKAKIGLSRNMRVLITHMHGDHVLGLPGLLQTMSLLERNKPLHIYGPKGIEAYFKAMMETVRFSLSFPVNVTEIWQDGLVFQEDDYQIHAIQAEHSIPSFAYALIEKQRPGKFYPEKARALGVPKGPLWSRLQRGHEVEFPNGRIVRPRDVLGPPRNGRKIVYSGDTRPSDKIVQIAKSADLLIHEATFSQDLAERAKEDGHSTPIEAAVIAKKAEVKLLVLTHISARYSDPEVLLDEAKMEFPRVVVAEDLMNIEVPLTD
ncbi:MAG: ribonuclease Z [Nitrososphaerota archaeon]|nr:ribonuclease Z [Nitrososphaerota archaeon]